MPKGNPKLTPEVSALICRSIEAGNYLETAAAEADVDRITVRKWVKRGQRAIRVGEWEASEDIYADFARAYEKASARGESGDVRVVSMAAGSEDMNVALKAATWRLERKNPRQWGQKINVTLESEYSAFLAYLETKVTPEAYEQVLVATADWTRGRGEEEAGGAEGEEGPERSQH